MSKGQEVIATLQRYFGVRVDPQRALAVMMAKISAQQRIIEGLSDILCGMAFDQGRLAGALADVTIDNECGGGEHPWNGLLALPRCELRNEVVEPNQNPPRVVLG